MLKNSLCLVVGVANRWSIAWGIAQAWKSAGADVIVTYQHSRMQAKVEKMLEDEWGLQQPSTRAIQCDISDPEQIRSLMEVVGNTFDGKLNCLTHSVAFASENAMKGKLTEVTQKDFLEAHSISTYSLINLTRDALPLLGSAAQNETTSPSILTLSYLGAVRSIPSYSVMGPAKASLEACVRGLAHELGNQNIRVNAISAGPISTAAAKGIKGFSDLKKNADERAPLAHRLDINDVGQTAVFLASDLSHAITGQIIYVDCGYSAIGI